MRVLLLGASGQLGTRIASRLRADGADLVETSRRAEGERCVFDPLRDDWTRLGRFQAVVNAIGIFEEVGRDTFEEVHVTLARRLSHAHVRMGGPRVTHLSALGARADHPSRFLATKAEGDRVLLERLGDRVTVLRPSVVCTPGTRLSVKLNRIADLARLSSGFLPVPAGILDTKVQPVLVEDVLETVVRSLHPTADEPRIVEIGGADRLRVSELLELALAARGVKLRPIELPETWTTRLVRAIPRWLARRTLTAEEWVLLREDNRIRADDAPDVRRIVGGPTAGFWSNELRRVSGAGA